MHGSIYALLRYLPKYWLKPRSKKWPYTYGPAQYLVLSVLLTLVSWETLFCTVLVNPYRTNVITGEMYIARFCNPYSPKRDSYFVRVQYRTTCTVRSTVRSCSLVQTHPPQTPLRPERSSRPNELLHLELKLSGLAKANNRRALRSTALYAAHQPLFDETH